MLAVTVERDTLRFGEHVSVSFERTVRVPEGKRSFPLPPSFGRFPIFPLPPGFPLSEQPPSEAGTLAVAIPMRPYEALWIGLGGPAWRPHAVKIGAGNIDVLSGERWDDDLRAGPQNYIVCPDQPWLDGINAGDGFVRQFVATDVSGRSLEGQLGATVSGGIRVMVAAPRPGLFPDHAPPVGPEAPGPAMEPPGSEQALALGVGGKIRQRIYPDPYGCETWDPANVGRAIVHLVHSHRFRALTGRDPPATPIDAQTYARLGLPWFELSDAAHGDLAPGPSFSNVRSVGDGECEATDPTSACNRTAHDSDRGSLPVGKLSRRQPDPDES